ncbi:OLC1v1003934C1 [Oldenlandia corymbosa var. corymbosa]|uniref:OLC1v1003934C1 n=1 Tax=Oldenlandia corymbosa var. corymbosa TaxID=529605 RepID=A0AAV1DBR9_OLDCO|nr:OLC1v1003934C1 [Oldenlandia corymbosa var. corymbosa]
MISWIIFILLATILSLNLLKHIGKKRSGEVKLPPGPWKLPIIGNIHNLMGSLPKHALENLARKYGDLMHLQLGEISTIVVSSPQLAKEVLKTKDVTFANRPQILAAKTILYNYSGIIFSPHGDYWRQIRKICVLELLSAKNVRSFGSIRQDEVLQLVSSIRDEAATTSHGSERAINLAQKVSSYTSSVVCRAAFGRSFGRHQEKLLELMKEVLERSNGFGVSDIFPSWKILHYFSSEPKMVQLRNKIDEILDAIIQEHIENGARTKTGNGEFGQEDLIDVLLRIKDNGGLQFPITNTYIKAIILDMFSAGSETSSVMVEWAMAEMIKNPNVLVKAQSEIRKVLTVEKRTIEETDIHKLSYLKLVIKETLRLHLAPALISRENMEDCEIGGYIIPPKTRVIINAWAIARDPRYWDNSDSFTPERFEDSFVDFGGTSYEFLPFGSGRRMCPGISFGLANIEIPLANMLCYFDWKLPDDADGTNLDMTEDYGVTNPRKNNLLLVPTMYESLGTV